MNRQFHDTYLDSVFWQLFEEDILLTWATKARWLGEDFLKRIEQDCVRFLIQNQDLLKKGNLLRPDDLDLLDAFWGECGDFFYHVRNGYKESFAEIFKEPVAALLDQSAKSFGPFHLEIKIVRKEIHDQFSKANGGSS